MFYYIVVSFLGCSHCSTHCFKFFCVVSGLDCLVLWTIERHASNLEKLKLTNARRRSGRSTHQGTNRKLNNVTSRVEEVCWNNACMSDVHITRPQPPTQHNHRGLALCSRCHPAWEPAKTPTAHWGPDNGEVVNGPKQRHNWRSHDAMTHHPDSPTHKSSDKQISYFVFSRLCQCRSIRSCSDCLKLSQVFF